MNPDLCKWSMWVHRNAPTYVKGPLCIMGDAAHAFTPWQGSGAGQSIEDALILSRLFGQITSRDQIPPALKAYDKTRRYRTQRIGDSSADTGEIIFGKDGHIGLDIEEMREVLKDRWDYIFNIDLPGHIQDALAEMEKEVAALP